MGRFKIHLRKFNWKKNRTLKTFTQVKTKLSIIQKINETNKQKEERGHKQNITNSEDT